jgi:uncharacterized protein (TIGR02001 family)
MKLALIAIAASALVARAAAADPAPAAPPGPCAGVYVAASAVSDYRFDGLSESNRGATWQATGYCYRNDGLFAGATFTGINFEDQPRTPVEADLYGGRQVTWGLAKVTFELFYSAFLGKRASGPSYDVFEPQVELSRPFKRLTLSVLGGWEASVSGGGQEWHAKAGASYALARWLSLSAHAGRFFAARGGDHDHDHWDVGATALWRRLTLDARYGGTDLPRSQCYYTRWCAPGAWFGVTWRITP